MPLAGTGRLFALQTKNWWSQLKTAGSAIYANRHYLELYRSWHVDRLVQGDFKTEQGKEKKCTIIGDVYIHPSATVDTTATVRMQKYICFAGKIGCIEASPTTRSTLPSLHISDNFTIIMKNQMKYLHFMLFIPCMFSQLMYQPANALNTTFGEYQTSTHFGTWVPCSGSLLEQRNTSPTC